MPSPTTGIVALSQVSDNYLDTADSSEVALELWMGRSLLKSWLRRGATGNGAIVLMMRNM